MENKDSHVTVIRKTHKNLRRKLANGDDFEKVWKSHCSDDGLLSEYSSAMEQLATRVWDSGCDGKDRTKWCKEFCLGYFHEGGMQKILEKDKRRRIYYEKDKLTHFICGPTPDSNSSSQIQQNCREVDSNFTEKDKIKLLDVGSCYNPLSSFHEFDTTAIDISPANKKVYKCDFLSVQIAENNDPHLQTTTEPIKEIASLQKHYYHVVLFSLLLSYVPCPHARWSMCRKAYDVLMVNGLLLIITPDSSHQNRRASLMKSWKLAIENIGFQRIKYYKDKHLHFIVFRKVSFDFIWDKRNLGEDSPLNILNIPQDFNTTDDDEAETCNRVK